MLSGTLIDIEVLTWDWVLPFCFTIKLALEPRKKLVTSLYKER